MPLLIALFITLFCIHPAFAKNESVWSAFSCFTNVCVQEDELIPSKRFNVTVGTLRVTYLYSSTLEDDYYISFENLGLERMVVGSSFE